jgi:hypothetical protein
MPTNESEEKQKLLEKLKNHVSQNLIHFQNVSRETYHLLANLKSNHFMCFDTESCKRIDEPEKERVWCWVLTNTVNDEAVYGYSLDDFFEFMETLYIFKEFNFDKKAKTKNFNIKMWVHNLAWDFEFFKYWLDDNNYTYYSKIMYNDKVGLLIRIGSRSTFLMLP